MERIKDIYRRYLTDTCTAEELKLLLEYVDAEVDRKKIERLLEDGLSEVDDRRKPDYLSQMVDTNHRVLRDQIERDAPLFPKVKKLRWRVSIAASAFLVCLFAFLYFNPSNDSAKFASAPIAEDVEPGRNRATLILSDGQKISLNEDREAIAIDGDAIIYSDGTEVIPMTRTQMVTVVTPRAGHYQVRLPDGTMVWLNAESSIEYPTAFAGTERVVTLNGEAYFEVVHKIDQPFVVATAKQRVHVLGTSFNVHAYPEEETTVTTLVTGSVKLERMDPQEFRTLEPHDQAILGLSGYEQRKVDARVYTAWKSGMFRFESTSLPDALKQLERWYDLDIDYHEIPVDVKVHASIRRDKQLSSILYALEEISGVKFKLQGRRLVVMK